MNKLEYALAILWLWFENWHCWVQEQLAEERGEPREVIAELRKDKRDAQEALRELRYERWLNQVPL